MKAFRHSLFWILVLPIAWILPSCSDAPERPEGLLFRYNESTAITSLDPAFARDQAHIWLSKQLFSTLVETDSNLVIQPGIALEWHSDTSGLHWRFLLRRDVFFHDDPCFGESLRRKLSAYDVAYTLNRLRDSRTASPGAWVVDPVDRVHVLDSFELALDLKRADATILGRLAMPYCGVVPQEAIAAYGDGFSAHPVGSGPFYFKAWARNEKLVLRRNRRYFEFDGQGRRLPYIEAVSIRFVPNRQAAFLEFLKGNLDMVSGVDPSYKDQLFDKQGGLQAKWQSMYRLQKSPFLNTEFIGLRAERPDPEYLGDVRVRQALNLALDREAMMRYLKNNIGIPGYGGLIPIGLDGHLSFEDASSTNEAPWHYDLFKAKQLILESGILEHQPLDPIVIHTTASYRDICEYVQNAWSELGLPVEVDVMPSAAFREDKAQGRLGVYRASWIADYPDAENYLMLFESSFQAPNGPNASMYSDSIYDSWVAAVRDTRGEDRIRAIQEADGKLKREARLVPLFYDESVRVFGNEWTGIPSHPMNMLDLRRARKKVQD